jgi:hypothetical protein
MSDDFASYSLEERIRGLVDQIDAYIAQYHGGGVKFISFDGKWYVCVWKVPVPPVHFNQLPCMAGWKEHSSNSFPRLKKWKKPEDHWQGGRGLLFY